MDTDEQQEKDIEMKDAVDDEKKLKIAANNMFTCIDDTEYLYNYPIYFDHKIPDALSSFPTLLVLGELKDTTYKGHPLITSCQAFFNSKKTESVENVARGSKLDSCVPTFYKKNANAVVSTKINEFSKSIKP